MTKRSWFIAALCALGGTSVASAQHHHHQAAPEIFQEMDKNNDGVVTLDEVEAKASEHFNEADTNKDGKISPEERKAMHEKWVREHFAEHDTNKNGKLERSELEGMPQEAFARLDKNKDGAVTLDEKMAMGPAHCKMQGKKGEGEGEADRDREMTKDKLMAKAEKKFAKIDQNKDGKVTEQEFTSFRKAKMEKHHECPAED